MLQRRELLASVAIATGGRRDRTDVRPIGERATGLPGRAPGG